VVRGVGKKDLGRFDHLLADSFTFSSAAGDDHISKSTFKKQCWDTQERRVECGYLIIGF
jgi:hypothetical protein